MGTADPLSPPPYNSVENGRQSGTELPPPYRAPVAYAIGDTVLHTPLINIGQLKAHLALLRAFKRLKTSIQDRSPDELHLPLEVHELDKDKRWTWFVGLAVERCVLMTSVGHPP